MSIDVYGSQAIGTVGQYLVAGEPYLTGSFISGSQEHRIDFRDVTKHVKIQLVAVPVGNELRMHFHSTSSAGGANIINNQHYWTITPSASFEGNVRCKELYLTVRAQSSQTNLIQYNVFAETTQITGSELYA